MTAIIAGEPGTTKSVWRIDPVHTEVGFEVKHLMIAKVRGRFNGVEGTIVLDETDLARSAVEVEIDAASIDTHQSQRDEHLRSADFLDVVRFPRLSFRSTRVTGGGERFQVVGDLTIHGVTRQVVLDVTSHGRGVDPWGEERAAYSATARIDRRDFGLTHNQALETGGVLVGYEVGITLEVQAVKAE